MPIDLRTGQEVGRTSDKEPKGGLDLQKVVLVETLLSDIVEYLHHREKAKPELKRHCLIFWTDGVTKHEDALVEQGKPTQEFLEEFCAKAAEGFSKVIAQYFPQFAQCQPAPEKQAAAYFSYLSRSGSLDALVYLGLADCVLQDVGQF